MGIREVLLVGGAAGVGKSTVGWEISVQLNRLGVAHWHLEGDVLDAAWPRPVDDPHGERLSVRTLRAMAAVFADEGYTRCVFVQTVSVVEHQLVTEALGRVALTGVLLTATEPTRIARLVGREIGTDLPRHIDGGATMARRLDDETPPWVLRTPTDGVSVADLATTVIQHAGWGSG
jgi:hypothetical protein